MQGGSIPRRTGLLTVLAFAGAVGCADSGTPTSRLIDVQQLSFAPGALGVSAGDTVVWVNRDFVPHTVTAVDGSWDSGELATGDSFSWVVERTQAIPFTCRYHPVMEGVLTLEEGP